VEEIGATRFQQGRGIRSTPSWGPSKVESPIITLLTDFGLGDAYVGAMKGVILSVCPSARIIDLSHEVPRHDVRHGAFLLSQAAPYFPEGTIHTVVIDPGVGTDRRRVVIEGRRCLYVGPDNGVLMLAVGSEGFIRAVEAKEARFMRSEPSKTFEGRDVFAPLAAHLANGVGIEEFGPEIHDLVRLPLPEPEIREERVIGEVIYIDGFGNLVTNIGGALLKRLSAGAGMILKTRIEREERELPFCKTYGDVSPGVTLLIIGSSGFVEISVNMGSARELFGAKVGDKVELCPVKRG